MTWRQRKALAEKRLMGALGQSDNPVPPSPVETQVAKVWKVTLNKTAERTTLGMTVAGHEKALEGHKDAPQALVVNDLRPGLAVDHNREQVNYSTGLASPEQIRLGDLIVEVNGEHEGPAAMLKRMTEDTEVVLTMRRVATKETSEVKHEDDEAHYAIDGMETTWGELNTTTEETKGEEDGPGESRGDDAAVTNQGGVVRVEEGGQKEGDDRAFEKDDWQSPCCGGRPHCLQGCKGQGSEKRRPATGSESVKHPSQQKKKLKLLEALGSSEQDQQTQAESWARHSGAKSWKGEDWWCNYCGEHPCKCEQGEGGAWDPRPGNAPGSWRDWAEASARQQFHKQTGLWPAKVKRAECQPKTYEWEITSGEGCDVTHYGLVRNPGELERKGLKQGDMIKKVNGEPFDISKYAEAVVSGRAYRMEVKIRMGGLTLNQRKAGGILDEPKRGEKEGGTGLQLAKEKSVSKAPVPCQLEVFCPIRHVMQKETYEEGDEHECDQCVEMVKAGRMCSGREFFLCEDCATTTKIKTRMHVVEVTGTTNLEAVIAGKYAQIGEHEGKAILRKIGCTADQDGAFSVYMFYVGTIGPWCGWWIADSVDSESGWAHAKIHTTYSPPDKGWMVQGVPSELRVVEISDVDSIQVFQ